MKRHIRRGIVGFMGVGVLVVGGWVALRAYSWTRTNSLPVIATWFRAPDARPTLTTVRAEPCPNAPFLLPSSGLIGLLYGDPAAPYTVLNRHTGVDIFGDGAPGTVPIVAAYDGWLTRLPTWRSSVIIRHDDPLRVGRSVWTYYTHMASRDGNTSFVHTDFPAGTYEQPVAQGQVIGYQGEYGGNIQIGMHLHFSVVRSDVDGAFLNESLLRNTLDPSPYLGMNVLASDSPTRPIGCTG
jgi:hypothetical protein